WNDRPPAGRRQDRPPANKVGAKSGFRRYAFAFVNDHIREEDWNSLHRRPPYRSELSKSQGSTTVRSYLKFAPNMGTANAANAVARIHGTEIRSWHGPDAEPSPRPRPATSDLAFA